MPNGFSHTQIQRQVLVRPRSEEMAKAVVSFFCAAASQALCWSNNNVFSSQQLAFHSHSSEKESEGNRTSEDEPQSQSQSNCSSSLRNLCHKTIYLPILYIWRRLQSKNLNVQIFPYQSGPQVGVSQPLSFGIHSRDSKSRLRIRNLNPDLVKNAQILPTTSKIKSYKYIKLISKLNMLDFRRI
jgi:hypothetical protein